MQVLLSQSYRQPALPGLRKQFNPGKTAPHAAGERAAPGPDVKTTGNKIEVDGVNMGKGLPLNRANAATRIRVEAVMDQDVQRNLRTIAQKPFKIILHSA